MNQDSRRQFRWVLIIGAVLIAFPFFSPSYWIILLPQMFIYGILAMSLDILMGFTGLPSFGHAGFFGASAYGVAILSTRYNMGFWACSLGGILLSLGIAALFGLIVAHSSGVYFLIITMALGIVLWGLALRWASVTGGDTGISGIPQTNIGLPLDLSDPWTIYYFTLGVFAICLMAMHMLIRSPFGLSLKGIRESEVRMGTIGYNTWLHKYLSYIIAGGFAGVAGVLWAYFNAFVSPVDLDIVATMEAFFMVILGGAGTLIGPALGAVIIIFLKNFFSGLTHRWLIVLGVIYIVIVLYASQGLVPWIADLTQARKKRTDGRNSSGIKGRKHGDDQKRGLARTSPDP